MARQLPADDSLSRARLRRAGLGVVAASAAALAVVLWVVWHAATARQARYVVRPELSVHGVSAGSVVRLNGVVVGHVARVGLWSDPVGGRARPEVVLALDAARDPMLLDLRRRVADGLRVQFISVNPASGFLEVELLWAPGSQALTATSEEDELPWQPSPQDETLSAFLPAVRRLAEGDLRARVDDFVSSLGVVEARLADAPQVAASAARSAARLHEVSDRLEQSDPGGLAGAAQGRLGEWREGLRVAGDALDALDRDLDAWPGSAARTLREFSSDCRSAVERVREQLPADAGR